MEDINVPYVEVHYVTVQKVGNVPITKDDFQAIPRQVQKWLAQMVKKIIFLISFIRHIYFRYNYVLLELYIFVMDRTKKQK